MRKHGSGAPPRRGGGHAGWRGVVLWSWLVPAAILVWQPGAQAADPTAGRKTYMTHCQNCHGQDGVGRIPGTPDFSRGQALLQPDMTLVRTIKDGKGMMPAYRGLLTEEELLDLVAFLRTLR